MLKIWRALRNSTLTGCERGVMMKTKNIFAILSLMGLLGALSPSANAMDKNFDIQAAIDNVITRGDHASLARCYEDAAGKMQAKVNEKKSCLNITNIKAISTAYARRICSRIPKH